jgi:hypothetical protein
MKRKLKWLILILAFLVLGVGTAFFLWPADRITPKSWKQIKIGMTKTEVESILVGTGLSYKEFSKKHRRLFDEWWEEQMNNEGGIVLADGKTFDEAYKVFWVGERGWMEIGFDQKDRVYSKFFFETSPSSIGRVRDWLGL